MPKKAASMYCWRKASQASSFSLQCSGFKPLASGFKLQSESFKLQTFQASSPSAFKRPRASSFNNISMGIKIDTSTSTAIVLPCTSAVLKPQASFTFKLQALGCRLRLMFSLQDSSLKFEASSFKLRLRASGCKLRAYSPKLPVSRFYC